MIKPKPIKPRLVKHIKPKPIMPKPIKRIKAMHQRIRPIPNRQPGMNSRA